MFVTIGLAPSLAVDGWRAPLDLDLIDDGVALLVLVGSHVSRQMVSLAEALVAHRTAQLLFPPSSGDLAGVFVLVMRPHVVDQIGRHPKGQAALRADILSGKCQCERGWKETSDAGSGRQKTRSSEGLGHRWENGYGVVRQVRIDRLNLRSETCDLVGTRYLRRLGYLRNLQVLEEIRLLSVRTDAKRIRHLGRWKGGVLVSRGGWKWTSGRRTDAALVASSIG